MSVPEHYLNPAMWRNFHVHSLYTGDDVGKVLPEHPRNAMDVYNPSLNIPHFVFCRVSDSTKRLENGLEAVAALDPKTNKPVAGEWGAIFTVIGSGSTIGVIVAVNTGMFLTAHCTPDGCHLVNLEIELPEETVVKQVFEFKTFRFFRIGDPNNDDAPHDLQFTGKKRWFRERNNPKFLGFNKDDKV